MSEYVSLKEITKDELRRLVGDKIYHRGENYLDNVVHLSVTDEGALAAFVMGSDEYVTSVLRKDKGTLSYTCSCPYDYGPCKHVVALLLKAMKMAEAGEEIPLLEPDDDLYIELFVSPADENDDVYQSIRPLLSDKSRDALLEILENLAKNIPDVYRSLHEIARLDKGDIETIETKLRKEIRDLTMADPWHDPGDQRWKTSDYSHLKIQLHNLLKKGYADTVVKLGTEFWEKVSQSIYRYGSNEDTFYDIASCMDIVMMALSEGSLPPSEQILRYIEWNLADEYELLPTQSDMTNSSRYNKKHWNEVAVSLEKRLSGMEIHNTPSSSERYKRSAVVNWLKTVYKKAGRQHNILPLMEKEADYCREYTPLIEEYIKTGNYKKARQWCIHGYNQTMKEAPGIASRMREQLRSLAEKEEKYDLATAYIAYDFFNRPSEHAYEELRKSAEKIDRWPAIRRATLEYLRTGSHPSSGPEEHSTWPLPPVEISPPDEEQYRREEFPDYTTLIRIALLEKRNDDAMKLYATLLKERGRAWGMEEIIAKSVQDTHPDFALRTWERTARNLIGQVKPKAYNNAAGYLRLMHRVYGNNNRLEEWDTLIARLRAEHKAKRRLMEVLDDLEAGIKS